MTDEDVVLKPKGNPFSGFGKGAGIGLKAKKVALMTHKCNALKLLKNGAAET
jgi:hypothetical protein